MFKNVKSVYLIGVGGISMSAIALLLKHKGLNVFGSDSQLSSITDNLIAQGIFVVRGESPEFVNACDLCIVSSAISENNSDVVLLKSLNKTIISRAQALSEIIADKKCISIAGTHGKTSTTGMLASVMLQAGLDPTVHIGGILNQINSNLHIGQGEYFLTEACEYKDSFLLLKSDISVVLNVESDHMDYFKNMNNLVKSFKKFAKNTKKYGFCILNRKNVDIVDGLDLSVVTFGNGGFVDARDCKEYMPGRYSYDLYIDNQFVDEIKLSAFGLHNVENSLAVVVVSLLLDIDLKDIKGGLLNYAGVQRRMELISNYPFVIHDYAHHPTEIQNTLAVCKKINKNIIAIFQPHLFSRTKDFYHEFLECFFDAKEVWLLPIYPAREKEIEGINSRQLSLDLSKRGVKSMFFDSFEACEKEIRASSENYLFVILGAGDIHELAMSLKNIEKTI
ncbi:MAG: UDP-N-acetylmuramate--L-alanine ligase [Clostridiales bacterium]|nr:UDP-N-acetylmuramate--L-alanine ligase [Clostridiales bacterium]